MVSYIELAQKRINLIGEQVMNKLYLPLFHVFHPQLP